MSLVADVLRPGRLLLPQLAAPGRRVLLVWVGVANNAPYKLRFPHLDYARLVQLPPRVDSLYFPDLARPADPDAVLLDCPDAAKLVANDVALTNWLGQFRPQGAVPGRGGPGGGQAQAGRRGRQRRRDARGLLDGRGPGPPGVGVARLRPPRAADHRRLRREPPGAGYYPIHRRGLAGRPEPAHPPGPYEPSPWVFCAEGRSPGLCPPTASGPWPASSACAAPGAAALAPLR